MFSTGGRWPLKRKEETYYLIRSDMLPEAIQKTVKAKSLLTSGEVQTVQEAVERVGMSRSSFYKYKDGVYPFNALMKEKIVTVALTLDHRSGVLSGILSYLARNRGNVLTIHQTIPLQGVAGVTMSLDTAHMEEDVTAIIDGLQELNGVKRAVLVARGE
ncbi:ACT domain-containing protein [Marinithermofilum abyssi]|uniref:ACT domain-containing protein n=1 Tax=Marinithermofilum abyssi TaxID=1571185 RepID=UPI001E5A86C7|nr:ACT domain-containing protein [Marinithermofilum abyssi]